MRAPPPDLAPEPVEVLFVLLPHSLALDWAGPAEAFRLANQAVRRMHAAASSRAAHAPAAVCAEPFMLRFVGPETHSMSSVGLQLTGIEPLPAAIGSNAWVVLVGSPDEDFDLQSEAGRALTHWLRQISPQLKRPNKLLTVCAGALYAAHAGLLAGRRVTTHHLELDELQATEPACEVLRNRVFVVDDGKDGTVLSSAGITTGIDLAIYLIAQRCGEALAARVAQTMVVHARRGPGDPQASVFLAHRQHLHAGLHRAQDAVSANPAHTWDVPALAQLANTSPRHLARLFAEHAGIAPLEYLRRIRCSAAEQALAQGMNVNQAALHAGFASATQLRRAWAQFKAGSSPQDARRT